MINPIRKYKFKKFEKVKSIPKTYQKVIMMTENRDMTAFQTPLGSFCLTSLPMGYANAPAEFQACMMFILQDKVPNFTGVFIDDVPIKGPASRYLGPDGREETIPYNPGI